MDKTYINIGPFISLFDAMNHAMYIFVHIIEILFFTKEMNKPMNSKLQTTFPYWWTDTVKK